MILPKPSLCVNEFDVATARRSWCSGRVVVLMLLSLFATVVFGAGGCTPWATRQLRSRLVGKPLPEATLTDVKGGEVRLGAYRGRPVVLNFWAYW